MKQKTDGACSAYEKQEIDAKFRSENLKDSHFEYLEVYGRKNTKTDHTEI
jgi:hypothetical protein